jgi:4-amino-4-deoxy-L-arabinose transferase-like glycosyltransferase
VLYFYPTIGVPTLYLIGRCLSALAGALAIPLVYALAIRSNGSRTMARIASLLLALSPLAVEHAHVITTDTAAMAIATFALLTVLRAEGGTTRHWVISGALGGLAAGIKYNAGLIEVLQGSRL